LVVSCCKDRLSANTSTFYKNLKMNNGNVGDSRETEGMRKLFVGGLKRETNEGTLRSHFNPYGEIVDLVIIKDNTTDTSRGFGFVTFALSNSVEECFNNRPHSIDGKEVEIKRAMPREFNSAGAHARTKRLFIGGFKGLTPDLQESEIQDYIASRHGNIGTLETIDLIKDKETGSNKGFGFLDCSSEDFADRLAISESAFTLRGRTLSIKKAEQKDGSSNRGGRGGARGGRGTMRGGRGGTSSGYGGYNPGGYGGNGYGSNQGGYNNYDNYDHSGYGSGSYGSGGYGNGGYGSGGYGSGGSYNTWDTANYNGGNSYGSAGGAGRYQPY